MPEYSSARLRITPSPDHSLPLPPLSLRPLLLAPCSSYRPVARPRPSVWLYRCCLPVLGVWRGVPT
eukprot:7636117-Lingulodinium_polyedra.AAC.1